MRVYVELYVICVTMETETVGANDLTNELDVQKEQSGAKNRTLGNTTGDWGDGGFVWTK